MHIPSVETDLHSLVHAHHTESVDPALVAWINDLLHDLLGWGPWTFVVVLSIAILLIPVWLIYNAVKHPVAEDEPETKDD